MLKPKNEIRQELLDGLAEKLGMSFQEEGNIALAIVDVILEEIYGLYEELESARTQAYLSTSTGAYTDLIAKLVGTNRESMETDGELKIRSSNSVYRNAKGNRLAIEEAALGVAGVASVDYRPFATGTGSFALYVYPIAGTNQVRIMDDVTQALETVVAEGIYFEVRQPTEVPVDVSVVLQFDSQLSLVEKQTVRNNLKYAIQRELNALTKNEVLYINALIQLAMQASPHVLDATITNLKINGISKTITNTFPENDERFISGSILIG